MKLTIHGYSTALFSTWYFIEELGILFDGGEGVTSSLLGKSGKIQHVFISHADRDHLTGLFQYNQLNSYRKPKIYYPKDSGSFPAMQDFFEKFDPQSKGTQWIPISKEETMVIDKKRIVKSIENEHIETKGLQIKSLSYQVLEQTQRLRTEFIHLPQDEIVELKRILPSKDVFINSEKILISYSGDTPVVDFYRFNNSEILIHEATFLTNEELKNFNSKNRHSSLEEVMKMVKDIQIDKLILGHFSSRYSDAVVKEAIQKNINYYNLKIPIYQIPIGKTSFDTLNLNPINQ